MFQPIEAIVRQAGSLVLQAHDLHVTEKSAPCDLVTEYDTAVQELLREKLLAAYPDAGFFAEEEAQHDIAGKPTFFVVDPIDGTTNFIRGLHHSCISVALCADGAVEYAAVYNPFADELFTARRGNGAFLNGKPIHVTNAPLERSLVLYGSAIYYRETIPATLRFIEELLPASLDFRRGGSAALDLCYVAAGKADLFFECRLRPWDYAAGSLIVQEAGGLATTLHATPLRFTQDCSVAAGTPENHPALLALSEKIRSDARMKGRIR